MSRTCDICGRGPVKAASRSHSNVKTLTRKLINLQSKKIEGKRVKICTKCLKTKSKSVKK